MTEDPGAGTLEFTVRRVLLHRLAEWAVSVVPTGHVAIPVYACFRVEVEPGRLCLTGANGERTVWASTQAVSTDSKGVIFLPARTLRQILAEAPEGEIRVSAKGNFARVTAGGPHWDLKMPVSSSYHELTDLAGAEFVPVGREAFLAALKTVRHAVGKDSSRPQYAQVNVAEDGGVMFAEAADSSQYARVPLPGFPFAAGIPASVLDDLMKLLAGHQEGEIQVAEAGDDLVFRAGAVTLAVRRLGKEFPDMQPDLAEARANEEEMAVDRGELQQAIRRVRITSDTHTSAIALVLEDGGARLTVQSRDKGENAAQEIIPAQWSGGHQVLVVSSQFLYEMLSVHPAQRCVFRVGRDRGPKRRRSKLLLEDAESKVAGTLPQMPPEVAGY